MARNALFAARQECKVATPTAFHTRHFHNSEVMLKMAAIAEDD